MADILIRGISMPKSCLDCNFSGDYGDCCCKDTEPYECEFHKKSRPDWCPLTELPEHGDLIDRDVLKHKFCAHCDGYENDTGACVDGDQDCMDAKIIMTAPVIVPSNKEDAE